MKEYIKSDLMRYYAKSDIATFFKAYFRNRTFRFQVAFRLCHASRTGCIGGNKDSR